MLKTVMTQIIDGFKRFKKFCLWCSNHLAKVIVLWLGLLSCAAIIYWLVEAGRSIWDGIWCAWITGLSIGYGDQFPVTPVGRTAFMVWGFVSIMIIAPTIIGLILEHLIKNLDLFSDVEQRLVMLRLRVGEFVQRLLLRDNRAIFDQNRLLMEYMVKRDAGEDTTNTVAKFNRIELPSQKARAATSKFWKATAELEDDEEDETVEEQH